MIFWLICGVLTLGVAGILAATLQRPRREHTQNPDVGVYRAQLDEIERDLSRGLLPKEEAERARAEVARRLIAATNAPSDAPRTTTPNRSIIFGIVAALSVVTFAIYSALGAPGYGDLPLKARLAASQEARNTRPSQTELEMAAPPSLPVDAPADYLNAIAKLRVIAETRPDDTEAWARLAYHESELRNFAAATRAQEHLLEILGDAASIDDLQILADLQVTAANGLISPEAETTLRSILARDEQNIAARYYMGALYNQTDRPDIAVRLWRDIAENGDITSFYVTSARGQIEDAAFRAGIDYSLPSVRGPSAADIDNAKDMTDDERAAMIGNMVAGLADRLANEGGPASDWARLIAAYGVLGDDSSARAVWVEAQQVFATNAAAMDTLTNAAQQAGLVE